ncbi:hypothetical protein QCA50_001379 [Cerrena zonata]|uniref:Uncharacterized protein n=1 Tax=Cerrena zonata TaxID=2478898 RepID=A0AAW0GQT9_9APHY
MSTLTFVTPSTPRRSQPSHPTKSISELKYTPPTPPMKSAPLNRKPSTLRRSSKASATPKTLKTFFLKASGKTTKKPRIVHLGDGRRVPMDWLPCKIDPFDYTLLELEEAQQREDIVYRMFPRRK